MCLFHAKNGYLFNDPLEDTEINGRRNGRSQTSRYLFNDPLEDTEIGRGGAGCGAGDVTCSTIR